MLKLMSAFIPCRFDRARCAGSQCTHQALFLDFDLRRLILHSSSVKRSSSIRSFLCPEMRSPCSHCSCCQQCRQIRRVDSGETASSVPIDLTAAPCEWSSPKRVSHLIKLSSLPGRDDSLLNGASQNARACFNE